MTTALKIRIPGTDADLAAYDQGHPSHPAVVMGHSILSSSMMWQAQADLLVAHGFRVIRLDTRGHGASDAPLAPYRMDDLAQDVITVLDALGIHRAHYMGLSLGGMCGFGLGVRHADRLLSLCICDARADMPANLGAAWNERIDAAQQAGSCSVLALATAQRWFGQGFLELHPAIGAQFEAAISQTSVTGFVGCAQAIQQLDYWQHISAIKLPTTLIVGAQDGPFPQVMRSLQACIQGARYALIPGAGHLPNIQQPSAFNEAMLSHFAQSFS